MMQMIITIVVAVIYWCLSIIYIHIEEQEKIERNVFLAKKRLFIGLLYVIAGAGIGWLFHLYQYSVWLTLEYSGYIFMMLLIGYIDKKKFKIPNKLLIMMFLYGMCCIIARMCAREIPSEYVLQECLFGLLLGGGTFFVGYVLSKGSLGLGDVKLMAVIGFLLGDNMILICMFLSLILSAIAGMVALIGKKKGMKDAIPFAPFVAAAVMILLVIGA